MPSSSSSVMNERKRARGTKKGYSMV
jgi:hypothetical protein